MQANPPAVKLDRAPIAILGVPFDSVNLAETLALAGEMVASGQPHYATTVGVDFLAEALDDVELRRILFDAHLVVAEEQHRRLGVKNPRQPTAGKCHRPEPDPEAAGAGGGKKLARVFAGRRRGGG